MFIVYALQGRTTRTELAFVERQRLFRTKIAGAGLLQRIAADCREVTQLRGCGLQNGLGEPRVIARHIIIERNVVEPRQCTDAEPAARQARDVGKSVEPRKINNARGLRDAKAKPIQEFGATAKKDGVRPISIGQRLSYVGPPARHA